MYGNQQHDGLFRCSRSDPACVNLYVTPGGSPTGDGTRVDPVNLPTAISLAQCNNAVIKLSVGLYNFDQTIQLFDYITIEGGFLPGSDWEKVSTDGTPATTTIINRTANGVYPYDGIAGAPALIAVQGNSISNFKFKTSPLPLPMPPHPLWRGFTALWHLSEQLF